VGAIADAPFAWRERECVSLGYAIA